MKTFVFILLCLISFQVSAVDLVIGPDRDSIPAFAFEKDGLIDSIVILPRGGKPLYVGEYSFWDCSSLKIVSAASDSPLVIAEGAFRDCEALESVNLPSHSLFEGGYCFSGCTSLKSVSLPETLEILPPHIFSYCSSLGHVGFPSRLKRIGNNAFSECRALMSVIIPDSVGELESYAFSGCTGIKEARLPANGALLGELIFSGCRSLERLQEPSPDVPRFDCDSYIFEPDDVVMYDKCVLEIPGSDMTSYSSAPGWSLFRNMKPISGGL